MGSALTTVKFYLVGKASFTRTGYLNHRDTFPQYLRCPDLVPSCITTKALADKHFLITGANSGIGKELSNYLYKAGATVHLVCRSQEKGELAKEEIVNQNEEKSPRRIQLYTADCGLEADMRRLRQEYRGPQLDGLVCNAGALLDSRTLTKENVEVTFATHLLFGTYLLSSLMMNMLKNTVDSRVIMVSSGGMYNTKYPPALLEKSTGESAQKTEKYNGQLAYAFAKRGQVLLAEEWAKQFPSVKIVSCHPGWSGTSGVDKAYGDKKSWLEPLRSPWEGAEGIAWLCAAPASEIETGAFYLDRQPQDKHINAFLGTDTSNTPEEVQAMLKDLKKGAHVKD